MHVIRIATRTSQLALFQAETIKSHLLQRNPLLTIELVNIKTQGDLILDRSLSKIGGKGLFVKELEQALLEDRADLAVHSVKDMPYQHTQGLVLGALGFREDPRDVLLSKDHLTLDQLKFGAVIGTSSLRRQMQLKKIRPDLNCIFLRGNVPTRIEKLKSGEFDAIILAAAGVKRLGLSDFVTEYLPLSSFLPAVGQGALGIECREGDPFILDLVRHLNDADVSMCVLAERAMNKALQGSCSVPIAGFAMLQNKVLTLTGRVGLPDGTKMIEASYEGSPNEPAKAGETVASSLIAQGAKEIFEQCKSLDV